jgi:prepilin-type processing-associated H-X9-DG protein
MPTAALRIEQWDEGKTAGETWEDIPGFSNNGIVEPCEIAAEPYYYYGFALADTMFRDDIDFQNFELAVEAFGERVEAGDVGAVDRDWPLVDDANAPVPVGPYSTVLRLREGIERFFITDINNPAAGAQAQSEVVTMHDGVSDEPTHFNHVPGGANVLFMDGHVDFLKYTGVDGEFPVNEGGLILHEHSGGGHVHP